MQCFSQYLREQEEQDGYLAIVHFVDHNGNQAKAEVRHPDNARTGAHQFVKKLPVGSKLIKVEYPY